jgi:release factor glutamine methyltransferase
METQSITAAGVERCRWILAAGAQRLLHAGIETARLDAEVILGHVLSVTREQLLASADCSLNEVQIRQYSELLSRRLMREPVAHIIGRQEFWSLDFHVTSDVLIPRPETERLVEIALNLAREVARAEALQILDIGTGSGAIAISLAKELSSSVIWATDISCAALEIAQRNAARHGAADQIHFLHGDLFAALGETRGRFALIVSNPPYIRTAEIEALEPEVRLWEPHAALDGGVDGLEFYRRIAHKASDYLVPKGAIAVEIGADMGNEVARLFAEVGGYADMTIFQDYAGRDRVVVAKLAGMSAKSI